MSETPDHLSTAGLSGEKAMVYRVLRYAPDPERNEWINIGYCSSITAAANEECD
jgi:hypothetical protein